jgi:hypothetical protein
MYLKRVFQRNFNQPPNGLGNDDQLFCNCFFLLMICIYIYIEYIYIYVYLDAIPTNNKNITWQRIKGLHLRTTEKLTTQGWEGNQTTWYSFPLGSLCSRIKSHVFPAYFEGLSYTQFISCIHYMKSLLVLSMVGYPQRFRGSILICSQFSRHFSWLNHHFLR